MRLASKASTISGEGVLAEDDIARGTSLIASESAGSP